MEFSKDQNFSIHLLHQFIKGDESAFTAIYHLFIDDLYAYGSNFSIANEILEDLIQDTFCHLYFHKEQYASVQNLKSYLFRILKNHILDYFRKPSSNKLDENDTSFYFNISVEDEYIQQEEIWEQENRIKKLLDNLSPQQREIIYLRYSEKMPYEEIAIVMECSCEVVRKAVSRSILKMKKVSEAAVSFLILLFPIL